MVLRSSNLLQIQRAEEPHGHWDLALGGAAGGPAARCCWFAQFLSQYQEIQLNYQTQDCGLGLVHPSSSHEEEEEELEQPSELLDPEDPAAVKKKVY